jgi:glycosyl transferase family 2
MSAKPATRGRVLRGVPSTPARRPAVTVVVPSYNYARYLRECAHSALTQRDVDVALVIVDDGSTDETPQVTAALAASDTRVTVVRNEPNRGHIPSVNEGLRHARTEYVVKLDADDLLAPGALARATALLEAHPGVGFVYGRPEHFCGPAPAPADAPTRSWTLWPGRDWVAARCSGACNVISQPEVVIRTSALRAVGAVADELPHTSDLHTWLRLASVADVGRVNGPVQGCYRIHDASMQRTVHAGALLDLRGRRDAYDAAFAAEAGALPGAEQLHATVRRRLAAGALDRACRAYDRGRTAAEPVDELVAFALDAWPGARALPEWRALEHRRAVGASRARRHPRFLTHAVARRAHEELGRRRWLRTGER